MCNLFSPFNSIIFHHHHYHQLTFLKSLRPKAFKNKENLEMFQNNFGQSWHVLTFVIHHLIIVYYSWEVFIFNNRIISINIVSIRIISAWWRLWRINRLVIITRKTCFITKLDDFMLINMSEPFQITCEYIQWHAIWICNNRIFIQPGLLVYFS